MSLNGFMHNLNKSNNDENLNENGPRKSLRKIDVMDNFLNTQVVNKYAQSWRSLTAFLKKNRMILFFNNNPDKFDTNVQKKILQLISCNKLDNKDVAYDNETGEIKEVFYKV